MLEEVRNIECTDHAIRQMQKRGIQPLPKDALEYAKIQRAPHDAFRISFRKKSVDLAIEDGLISPQEGDRIMNTHYIVERSVLAIIVLTAYKQEGGNRKIRNIHRAKRRQKSHDLL